MNIELNPYANVDFEGVKVPSITHEHTYTQAKFESCYNRGIRMIPATHYQPSVSRYPLTGWNNQYLDWLTDAAETTTLRNNTGSFADFIDSELNAVTIADIPSLPNSEKVNMSDFSGHLTCLGSGFGDAGWNELPSGIIPPEGIVTWRQNHPLLSLSEMINNIQGDKLYDKVFMTINHPTNDVFTYLNILNTYENTIKGFEGWNNYFSDAENTTFRNKYDQILKAGKMIWILAVVDWQGYTGGGNVEDLGCNVLFPSSSYDLMTKAQKEQELLNCYDEGRFYASGKMTFELNSVDIDLNICSIKFSEVCDYVKIITNLGEQTVNSVDSVSKIISSRIEFIRFEGWIGTDFIFTQPVFFENNNRNIMNLSVF